MDALLALIIAMLVFALLIVIISRSYRTVLVLGTIMAVVLVLRALGVF